MRIQDEELVVGSLKSLSAEDVVKLVTLSQVSRALNLSHNVSESLTSVLEALMAALNADRGFIQLCGSADAGLEIAIDRSSSQAGSHFAYSNTLVQQGLAGTPVLMLDAKVESAAHSAISSGVRSVMIQPMVSREVVVGVIYLDSLLKAGRFRENELRLLGIIADMISVFLERTHNASALVHKSRELELTLVDLKEANQLLSVSAAETIFKLSRAGEFRDDEGGGHVQRVSHYCEAVALQLGFSPAAAADIRMASQLHDVGKVGLPDSILLKTGKYTEHEREVMKQHTWIGAKILGGSSSPVIRLAEETALTHHEKWNGTGYPRGLSGEQIPLSGRIVAVADVFDALVTERRYKPGWSTERAFQLISDEAGAHFDPQVAQTFLGLKERILEIRARFQPEAQAAPIQVQESATPLQTRAQGREALEPIRQAIDALSRASDGFNPSVRAQALTASRQISGLLGSLGLGLDFIRRLEAHFQREDLLPEQAPRLAELLAEVENSLAEPATGAAGGLLALLVDPNPHQRDALATEASYRGVSVVEAHDIAAARRAVGIRPPEFVIIELAQEGAHEFLDWLAQEHPLCEIVVLTSENTLPSRLKVAARGGQLYFDKPLSAATVFDEIQELLLRRGLRPYRVLSLGQGQFPPELQVRAVDDLAEVFGALAQPYDVLLVDLDLHPHTGLEICRVLRGDPRRRQLPILALSSDDARYRSALQAGADDVLLKPLKAEHLLCRIETRLARHHELRKSSSRDPLTGLTDMPVALRAVKHIFALAVKNSVPFTIYALTLELFPELVQTRGQAQVSQILCQMAEILEPRARTEDVLMRSGEDCILLGLYGLTAEAAAKRTESLNARLGELYPDGKVRCTPRTACYPEDGTNLKQLLEKVGAGAALSLSMEP